jgi:hypothetical protein
MIPRQIVTHVLQGHPEKYHWFPNVKPFMPVGDQTHVGVNIKNLEPFMIKKFQS